MSRLIRLLHPILDAHECPEKTGLAETLMVANGRGGRGAEIVLRMQRVMLTAVMVFSFPRTDHAGMRFVDNECMC